MKGKRTGVSGFLAFLALLVLGSMSITFSLGSADAAIDPELASPLIDGTEPLPPGVVIDTILPGMNLPIAMAWDPAGRLFYTEKSGAVRLFENGVLQPTAVINFSVNSNFERGLLGIALDPNFTTNRYIYVYYSASAASENRVVRFEENNGVGTNPQTIFTSPQTAGNHVGGNIHFGSDGKLYISIGDNANAANAQNVGVRNGKMHRINAPDGSMPSDNPVFTQTGALPSLYAMGLRNSFDFTFDPLTPPNPFQRIFASENGPGCDDEMNRIEPAYNYGWRASYPCGDTGPQYNTIPHLWWLGSDAGAGGPCCEAPTGIVVYTGTQIPQWTGHLFMANYNSGDLRHFYLNSTRTVLTGTNRVVGINANTDLINGPDGAFWYIEGGGYSAGTLKRIRAAGPTLTPTATATTTPCPPQQVQVNIQNFLFVPMTTTVYVGHTVRWTNLDLDPHTSTSAAGGWDSGILSQNQSFTHTMMTPGTFPYVCTLHPGMVGTVVVLTGCPPTVTPTRTNTPTPTRTSCATPTNTFTPVFTPTGTNTPVPGSPTDTPLVTNTPTGTNTPVVTNTPCVITFLDVLPTDYFYEPVRYLYCNGVISGYADNTFRPYNNTTRGQLTKIVVLAFGIPLYTPPSPTFSDVPTTHTFYQYIETAAYEGLVSGYADGTFRPQNDVTRGQLSKIVVEAAGWQLVNPPTPTFSDVPTGHTFFQYVETAYDHGIITGYADGTFRPGNNATRGQISKIVYQAVIAP